MGMTLKTCLASLAVLAATAAHAEGKSSPRSTEASARQAVESAAPDRHVAPDNPEAAGEREHTMSLSDQRAGEGGGSAEPQVDRAATGLSEKEVDADWTRQEFLRNVWSTP